MVYRKRGSPGFDDFVPPDFDRCYDYHHLQPQKNRCHFDDSENESMSHTEVWTMEAGIQNKYLWGVLGTPATTSSRGDRAAAALASCRPPGRSAGRAGMVWWHCAWFWICSSPAWAEHPWKLDASPHHLASASVGAPVVAMVVPVHQFIRVTRMSKVHHLLLGWMPFVDHTCPTLPKVTDGVSE